MAFGRLGAAGTGFGRLGSTGSGGGVAAAVGGGALLTGEANGFAADFTYATDASRVAVKTAGTVVSSGTSFFTSSGTSSKWVYNSAGTLVNIPVGTLPLDYDPVTHAARGLLCEPAATNLCLQSQTFDNAFWAKQSGTIAANAIAAPDGTTTADAYIPGSGSVDSHLSETGVLFTVSQTYTLSFYIKNGTLGNNWLQLLINQTSTINTYFNLSTGAIGTSSGTVIARTINSVGSGWYRVVIAFTASDVGFGIYFAPRGTDGGGTVTGNGTSPGYYIWGAQIETGTVATSPIPTTSATVTRAADKINITPASINYSATAGSWWMYMTLRSTADSRPVSYMSSTMPIWVAGATAIAQYDGLAYLSRSVGSVLGAHKVASTFASADRAITVDGLAVITDTQAGSALLSPGAAIGFGYEVIGGANQINGHIHQLYYVPRRMPNAELVTETA